MVVYKIVATEEWGEAEAAGVFTGAAVDRADGFIHFSTAEQAPETAAKWFAGRERFDAGRNRRRGAGQGLALGAVARRRALSPSLCAPADERRRLVAPAAARTGRRPCFREPRGVRLAKVAGPVLRRLPAETAHRAAINALEDRPARPARRRPIRGSPSRSWGCEFPNPLGLAAGFDKNAEVPGAMLKLGFGFVEVGTLTPRPQGRQRPPAVVPACSEDAAVINRFGFNNEGFERARARLERRPPGLGDRRRQRRRQQGRRRPRRGLCARRQDLRRPRRLSDHQHLLAQHARFARPAAARGARRPDRAGGRRARRDRAAPPADAQDRARSRRARARGHRRDRAHPSHRRPHRLEHHGRAARDA